MFVLVQCLNSRDLDLDDDLTEVMAKTMQQAGVAVTVTSLTDIAAFLVGSTAVSNLHLRLVVELLILLSLQLLPGLHSFCVFTAFCIFFVYTFQVTWFFAWCCLDHKRILQGRHALLFWIDVDNAGEILMGEKTYFSSADFWRAVMDFLALFIQNKGTKVNDTEPGAQELALDGRALVQLPQAIMKRVLLLQDQLEQHLGTLYSSLLL